MTVSTERDDLLLAYAAGMLPEAPSLVVAAQASLRSDVRRAVGEYEAVAGALLEESEAAELSCDLRANVLALLDEDLPDTARPPQRGDQRVPAPLWGYVGTDVERLGWRRVMPGLKDCVLPTSGGGTARLMWVKGGTKVPAHTHQGLEMTLVLEGAFSDPTGTYGPGDLQLADGGLDHSPAAESGSHCLCLVVTEAPIRLTGRFGRLMNRFIRY